MKTSIVVKTRFEGFHRWPKAPDEVGFLRDLHRHEFHVELKIEVFHDDRELEFILVKRALDAHIKKMYIGESSSCEMIARDCIIWVKKTYGERSVECGVFEDGENGAVIYE